MTQERRAITMGPMQNNQIDFSYSYPFIFKLVSKLITFMTMNSFLDMASDYSFIILIGHSQFLNSTKLFKI